jgi:ubiquinone/menaquinone biosynthesis C-methylase UbiE
MPNGEQWQLSGNAAELYERVVVRYNLGLWAPVLIERADLQRGERVLDIACGTGVVTRLAAQQVGAEGQVTGLDLNPGMLAVARSLSPVSGASITWVESSAVAMDVPDAAFDVVVCQQGLQFFPDQPAALREIRRVLVPGGRVILSVWKGPSAYSIAVSEAIEKHVDAETATRFHASKVVPSAEALHRLLVDAGFLDVNVHPVAMTIHAPPIEEHVPLHLSATPIAAVVAALNEETRTALVRDAAIALQPYVDGDGVALSEETHIVTAHS